MIGPVEPHPSSDRFAEQLFVDPEDLSAGRRALILAGSLIMLCGVAAGDYFTGYELSFSPFYLLPVGAAAWYGGRTAGLGFAVVSAAVWAISDRLGGHTYSHWAIPFWNAGVRLAYFGLVAELMVRLQRLVARERRESETDPLTGAFNRAGWFEAVEIELARARRSGKSFAVASVDLDNFKLVNDTRGHPEGDRVLQEVARVMRATVRRSDVVARIGGDEFAVLLPEAGSEGAKELGLKLHRALTEAMAREQWRVGFSVGVAAFATAPATVQELMSRADAAMYSAKRAGKNIVRVLAPDDTA